MKRLAESVLNLDELDYWLRFRTTLKLVEVARRCGLTAAQLWNIRTGKTPNPGVGTIYKLAETIGIPFGVLVTQSGRGYSEDGDYTRPEACYRRHDILMDAQQVLSINKGLDTYLIPHDVAIAAHHAYTISPYFTPDMGRDWMEWWLRLCTRKEQIHQNQRYHHRIVTNERFLRERFTSPRQVDELIRNFLKYAFNCRVSKLTLTILPDAQFENLCQAVTRIIKRRWNKLTIIDLAIVSIYYKTEDDIMLYNPSLAQHVLGQVESCFDFPFPLLRAESAFPFLARTKATEFRSLSYQANSTTLSSLQLFMDKMSDRTR